MVRQVGDMRHLWQYLLVEPFTWIFFCFFQPKKFRRYFVRNKLREAISSIARLVLPIFLLSYSLALVVRLTHGQLSFTNLLGFTVNSASATLVAVIVGIAFSVVTTLETGITITLVLVIIEGIMGIVVKSIIWSFFVILILSLVRRYTSSRYVSNLSSILIEGIVGGIVGGLFGSIVGGIAGGLVGSILGIFIGSLLGSTTGDTREVLLLLLVASVVGSISENVAEGVAVSIAGGFLLGISAGDNEQDIGPAIVYAVVVAIVLTTRELGSGPILLSTTLLGMAMSYLIAHYRILLYPISGMSTLIVYVYGRRNPLGILTYLHQSSLYWDECVFLPLPGLKSILLLAALRNDEGVFDEINFIVAARPQQLSVARAVSLQLIVLDMEKRDRLQDIANFSEQLDHILPPKTKLIHPRWIAPFVLLNRTSEEAFRYYDSSDWQSKGDALEKMIANLKRIHPELITDDLKIRERLFHAVNMWMQLGQNALELWEKAQERSVPVEQVIASLRVKISESYQEDEFRVFCTALEEYYQKYPNERLMLEGGGESVYYEYRVQAAYAWQCWKTARNLIFSGKRVPDKLLEDLADILVSSLLKIFQPVPLQAVNDSLFYVQLDVREIFGSLRLSEQLPVILYTRSQFQEKDASELLSLMRRITPRSPVALILFFLVPQSLQAAIKLLEDNLQGAYAYDFIPVDQDAFTKIIGSKDPRVVFQQLIFSRVDLKLISPFITSGPVPGPMFFGREHELLMISRNAHSANYALIGGRRIGKTSILTYLMNFRLPSAGYRAFYLDCGPTRSLAELVEAVTLNKSWFSEPPAPRTASFVGIMHLLPDDKPLVILLDEVDRLIANDRAASYPLCSTLRALASSGRCHFVLSGEQSLRSDLKDPDSPLYNFADEILIGCLEVREMRELVIQPMTQLGIELADKEEIVQLIWNFTSGQPSIVQHLCQRLIERLKQEKKLRLTTEDVEAVINDYSFLNRDFLTIYLERATSLERLCVFVMARDRRLGTLTALYEALSQLGLDVTLNQVNEALERLVELRNILHYTSDGYMFIATTFPEVIARSGQLDERIALTCERYKQEASSKGRIQ